MNEFYVLSLEDKIYKRICVISIDNELVMIVSNVKMRLRKHLVNVWFAFYAQQWTM